MLEADEMEDFVNEVSVAIPVRVTHGSLETFYIVILSLIFLMTMIAANTLSYVRGHLARIEKQLKKWDEGKSEPPSPYPH